MRGLVAEGGGNRKVKRLRMHVLLLGLRVLRPSGIIAVLQDCSLDDCPVDCRSGCTCKVRSWSAITPGQCAFYQGQWTDWSDWHGCSKTCGGGKESLSIVEFILYFGLQRVRGAKRRAPSSESAPCRKADQGRALLATHRASPVLEPPGLLSYKPILGVGLELLLSRSQVFTVNPKP